MLTYLCTADLLMLCPAWVSTLCRKQRADCSPRIFLRGLHTAAAGPQPTERQRLHSSCPKGLSTAHLFSSSPSVFFLFTHPSLSISTCICSPELPSARMMWLDVQKHGCLHLKLLRCKDSIWINMFLFIKTTSETLNETALREMFKRNYFMFKDLLDGIIFAFLY